MRVSPLYYGSMWLIRVRPEFLYLTGVQDQPSAALMRPNIVFDMRMGILTLKIIYLDLHEGILYIV